MDDEAGDSRKYTHDFVKESATHEKKEIRFSYPSLMESQIRKLKHGLEPYKEIVLHARRVLIWEKQWHPTALMGGSTILFTFLWLLDPSILTVVSVFGLLLTVCDYLLPSIAATLFKTDKWTTNREQEFEDICTNIILYKVRLELTWGRYYRLKSTNKKMYFTLTIVILSALAWIGCTFNNLFLAYVLTTFLLLLPGLEHSGLIRKWNQMVQTFVTEFFRKSKVPEKKD